MPGLYYPGCEVADWVDMCADLEEMAEELPPKTEEEIEEMYEDYRRHLEEEEEDRYPF